MIGGDDIDASIENPGAHCCPIIGGFYRRIPFDVGPFGGVIGIGKPQVVDARLCRDFLFNGGNIIAKKGDFTGRRNV